MKTTRKSLLKEKGFTAVETVLVIVLVVAIAGVGYYVYHSKHNKSVAISSSPVKGNLNHPSPAINSSSESTSNIDSELSSVSSANSLSNQSLQTANSGVNDQSTFTAY